MPCSSGSVEGGVFAACAYVVAAGSVVVVLRASFALRARVVEGAEGIRVGRVGSVFPSCRVAEGAGSLCLRE